MKYKIGEIPKMGLMAGGLKKPDIKRIEKQDSKIFMAKVNPKMLKLLRS